MSHVQMNTADSVTQKIHNSSFSGQIDIIHIYLDVQISLQPFTICSHPIKQTSNEIPTYLFKITSHIEVAYTIMAISQMNHNTINNSPHYLINMKFSWPIWAQFYTTRVQWEDSSLELHCILVCIGLYSRLSFVYNYL